MTEYRAKAYQAGNSQAVRPPKAIAFGDGQDLTLIRMGDVLTNTKTRPSVREMMDALARLPKLDRIEIQDDDAIPERDGL